MRAKAVDDVLFGFICALRYRGKSRYANVAGDVEHPKLAAKAAVMTSKPADERVVDAVEIDAMPSQSVVPPDRNGIPLYQLKQTLQDGLFDGRTRRAPVRIGPGKQ